MIQIDVQMPSNCYDCWIRKNLGCRIANDNGWLNNKRSDDCPLKAQEPRVMTLEEYEAWVDIPFTERNPVFCEERTRRGSICYWANTTVYSRSEYGKNKRCWTSRPTEEQREATPWE